MVAFTKIDQFAEDLGLAVHNLNTAALKIALTNTQPVVATAAVLADITQITAQNGYSAGGATVASTAYSETAGTGALTGTDVVFTASGGSFGPFRYAVLYNDTATNDPLIGFWDYGSSISINDTETFTVDFGTNILTVA